MEAAAAAEDVRGTLVALRRVSARLFFGDLEADGPAGVPPWSLVFKRDLWCAPRSRFGVFCYRAR